MKLDEMNRLKEYARLNSQVFGLSFSGLLVFAILLFTAFPALATVLYFFAILAITFCCVGFLLSSQMEAMVRINSSLVLEHLSESLRKITVSKRKK